MRSMPKELSILEAKFEAQKLAFGPIYFHAVLAMKKLGILELIGKNRKGITGPEIADLLSIDPYGVEVLLEAGYSAGVIQLDEDQKARLTKVGVVLNSDRLTEVNLNFVNDVCYDAAKFTTESVVNHKPEGLKIFGNWKTVYEGLSQLPEHVKKSWFEFDHYYSSDAFADAMEIVFAEAPKMIFDIGGNTGKWAIACCNHNKDVKVKMLDLPGQIGIAKKNLEQYEFGDRISYHPIDVLDKDSKIPSGADVVWMSQFLDCFSESEIVDILQKVKASMDEHTTVFILEPLIDNQAYPAAGYSLIATSLYFTTVANGNSKMYSERKMRELISKAGLKLTETYPLIGHSYHSILKVKNS